MRTGADIQALSPFHTDFHLLDSYAPGQRGGTGETFAWELARLHRGPIPMILSGGLNPDNVAEAIARVRPFAVDVASGVEAQPGPQGSGQARGVRRRRALHRPGGRLGGGLVSAVEHRFGPYGGQYVPETLMPALAELEAAWVAARDDAGFQAQLSGLLSEYVGRPSPLYFASRLSEAAGHPDLSQARGPQPHRRAQDQQRHRPGAAGQADGQDGGSSPRPGPASTAWPPPRPARCSTSSASSTWAPRTCAASAPTCSAWSCSARSVAPVEAGARTLKEAVSAAIRDWVSNVGDTHYIIGSCVGPAPYPALVRDLQRVIGDEARAQVLRAGRAPARARDRLRRGRLQRDRHLHPLRRRRRGRARSGSRRPARASTPVATGRR